MGLHMGGLTHGRAQLWGGGSYVPTSFGVSNNIYCTYKLYREPKEIQTCSV